jgi:hypothetical protein
MTADRFAGPVDNICDDVDTQTLELKDEVSGANSAFGVTSAAGLLFAGLVYAMA